MIAAALLFCLPCLLIRRRLAQIDAMLAAAPVYSRLA